MKPAERSHLADDRLIEVYFAECEVEEGLEGVETARRHLEACASCARRYRLISDPLERLRDQAVSSADAVFTDERLHAQREHILYRLEAGEHPVRVIPFPFASSGRHVGGGVRVMKRWVAVAAAAGLLVGVGLGRLATISSPSVQNAPPASVMVANQPIRPPAEVRPIPASSGSTARSNAGDEAFLSALDDAVNRRVSITGLQAIDALTPHVREATVSIK